MQLSRFIKVFPYPDKPDSRLVYSTKKTSLLLLREDDLRSIENGAVSPADRDKLLRFGVLADDSRSETEEVMGMIDELQRKDLWCCYSVFLNLECNFSCVYCYEGGMKGHVHMSDDTVMHLVEFIKRNFPPGKKYLNLDFYGGEPLLSMGLIKAFSAELQPFAEGRGAKYLFSLVTNGSLFKRKLAEELLPLGLRGGTDHPRRPCRRA